MEPYIILCIAFIAIVCWGVIGKVYKSYAHDWVVWSHQTGLHFHDGKLAGRLEAGKHRVWGAGHNLVVFDNRISEMVIQGQEVITSDCATLKLTAVAQWRIVNPEKFHLAADNTEKALYTLVQFALRQVVGGISLDDIIEKKSTFGEALLAIVRVGLDDLGIEVIRVDVRDVMLSAELKTAYQGVLTARKQSLSNLEKARGEAAALRTLANASRLFESNPELMQMKYLETLKEAGTSGYGNTLIIGVPEELASLAKKS